MIYADSGIIMRWVEGADSVRAPIERCWQQLSSGDRLFITSRLARLECRCRPLRDQDDDLLHLYDVFFAGKEVDIREINAAVVEKATAVRAAVGLKVPDAIHVATATLAGVAEFWTTDQRLSKCPGLTVRAFSAV
jgi:predicted nucleic acid-binding protein